MVTEKSRVGDESKIVDPDVDVELDAASSQGTSYATKDWHYSHRWTRKLLELGLETRGA